MTVLVYFQSKQLTVAAHFGPCGTETSESYLSRQDGEIDKNYPQGPRLKFRGAFVEPIKFFWTKKFNRKFNRKYTGNSS